MLGNYILTAWRGARRDISGFLINIIGLLVGFTVFTLSFSVAHYIGSFDTGFSQSQRTYSLGLKLAPGNMFGRLSEPFTFTGAIDGLKEKFPEIILAGRVIAAQASYKKDGAYLPMEYRAIDPDALSIFDVEITKGSAAEFTDKIDVALLSEREAKHHFGNADPIGQTINIDGTHPVVVIGVFKNLPANTHLMVNQSARSAFDFLVSIPFYERLSGQTVQNGWNSINSSIVSYVVTNEGLSIDRLTTALTTQLHDHMDEENRTVITGMWPRPITEIQSAALAQEGIDISLILRLVGSLILGLAVLNAISLASARMINRSREIGLRRVFGASKSELSFQFIAENTLYAFIALAISILLAFDLFDWLRDLSGFDLQFTNMLDFELILGLVAAALAVGLISSLYPVLLFSGILKNVSLNRTLTLATSSAWLRKILVSFQFAVVTALIFAFIVVQLQNKHLMESTLKIDTENMAAITGMRAPGMSRTVSETVKRLPGVKSISRNNLPPYSGNFRITGLSIQGVGEGMRFRVVSADNNYFNQLGVSLLAGRMLDETREMDIITQEEAEDEGAPVNHVINETAMRALGFSKPADIIGHTFIELDGDGEGMAEHTIIGVAPDLRLTIPNSDIMPTLYSLNERSLNSITIVYEDGAPINITALNNAWQAVDPAASVQARPLNVMAGEALAPFETTKTIGLAITFVTLTMAAAGLYALTAYLAAGKKREVSIRKVHGAPLHAIIHLLMWQFTKPVMLAVVVVLPVMFFVMKTLVLETYAVRINLDALPVALTVSLVLIMAWGTTLAHIVRTARTRPAVVLRSE